MLKNYCSHHKEPESATTAPLEFKEEKVAVVDDEAEDYHDMAQRVANAKKSVEALKAAEEATEKYGITSPEARSAWELVEELAATATHHKATGSG